MTKPKCPKPGWGEQSLGICNGPPAHEPFGWAEAVGGVVMLTATALTLTEKAEVRTAPDPVP